MTIEEIEQAVLKHYPGVTSEDLKTDSREQRFVQPRLAIWYIARYTYSIKIVMLAQHYCRDHSTICKMLWNAIECREFNKAFQTKVDVIITELLEPQTAIC